MGAATPTASASPASRLSASASSDAPLGTGRTSESDRLGVGAVSSVAFAVAARAPVFTARLGMVIPRDSKLTTGGSSESPSAAVAFDASTALGAAATLAVAARRSGRPPGSRRDASSAGTSTRSRFSCAAFETPSGSAHRSRTWSRTYRRSAARSDAASNAAAGPGTGAAIGRMADDARRGVPGHFQGVPTPPIWQNKIGALLTRWTFFGRYEKTN